MRFDGADKTMLLRVGTAGLMAIAILSPALAQAASGGSGALSPVSTTLTTLITALTGPIATSLAILSVIALGFLAFVGRLSWGIAGSIIAGIVLIFGSTQIVSFFQTAASG